MSLTQFPYNILFRETADSFVQVLALHTSGVIPDIGIAGSNLMIQMRSQQDRSFTNVLTGASLDVL